MPKRLTLFVFALFLCYGLQAQSSSEKAGKLLSQVAAKVKSYDNMVIEFDYIIEVPANHQRRKTKGKVSLQGEKYKLDLMGVTRIFDGTKLYSIVPADEEVTISNYDPKKDKFSPSQMLTFFQNGFTYQWDIAQNVMGRKIQYVKLTPKAPDSEIKTVLLGIDVQTKNIYKLIQIRKDGSKAIIEVNSFKTNQPLSGNMFSFDKDRYQGYYINRLD